MSGLQYEIVWVLHEIRFEKPSLLRTELTASGTVGFTLYSMGLHSSIYPVCPESAKAIDKGVSSKAERA